MGYGTLGTCQEVISRHVCERDMALGGRCSEANGVEKTIFAVTILWVVEMEVAIGVSVRHVDDHVATVLAQICRLEIGRIWWVDAP